MFKKLNEILDEKTTLTFSIKKKDDILTVSVLAHEKIKPIILTGTAEDLNQGFIDAIKAPIVQIQGLQSNLDEIAKEIEKVQAEAKKSGKKEIEKTEKTTSSKTPTAAEKKKEFDSLMAEAEKEFELKHYDIVIERMTTALGLKPNDKKAEALKLKGEQWKKSVAALDEPSNLFEQTAQIAPTIQKAIKPNNEFVATKKTIASKVVDPEPEVVSTEEEEQPAFIEDAVVEDNDDFDFEIPLNF